MHAKVRYLEHVPKLGMTQLNTEGRSCPGSQCVCFPSKYEALTSTVSGKNIDIFFKNRLLRMFAPKKEGKI